MRAYIRRSVCYVGAGTAGYAGAGTGGYQPPAPTSSAVKRASYQDNSDYSEKSEQSPDGSGSGNSGRQYLGLGASGVAGSGPVSTGTSSTGNTTSGGIISNGKITLPTGCENANGIGFGWLPNDNSASLAADESAVGKKTSLLRWILRHRVPSCRTLRPSLDDFVVSRISLTIMTFATASMPDICLGCESKLFLAFDIALCDTGAHMIYE